MQKRSLRYADSGSAISIDDLEHHCRMWLLDGEIRQLSSRTIKNRKLLTEKLLWYLRDNGFDQCGVPEIKSFLAYASNGHTDPRGRWGNPAQTRKVRPRTVSTHFGNLRTFFRYLVAEGVIEESPVESIKPPICRRDQIEPFTRDQLSALIDAARKSSNPRRDEAIVIFLLDTGVRVSELCAVRVCDLDLEGCRCKVLGKGNKHRMVSFGKRTLKTLWNYLRKDPHDPDSPLFLSDRGRKAGEGITPVGVLRLIRRLGKRAGIKATRCSPHTFRHTFAVEFLRNGANVFTLKELLGHTTLAMVNRYVAFAQADIENQHRQYSPADGIGK